MILLKDTIPILCPVWLDSYVGYPAPVSPQRLTLHSDPHFYVWEASLCEKRNSYAKTRDVTIRFNRRFRAHGLIHSRYIQQIETENIFFISSFFCMYIFKAVFFYFLQFFFILLLNYSSSLMKLWICNVLIKKLSKCLNFCWKSSNKNTEHLS